MSELPAWVDDYRGRPFLRGANGPDAYDCYGLVRRVLLDRWGAHTPSLDGAWHLDAAARLAMAVDDPATPWLRVPGAALEGGDVLTFVDTAPPHQLHVGIVVAPGWMLHAQHDTGVVTARYDRAPWALLRFGAAWRHVAVSLSRDAS